jgi:hypothetical protein
VPLQISSKHGRSAISANRGRIACSYQKKKQPKLIQPIHLPNGFVILEQGQRRQLLRDHERSIHHNYLAVNLLKVQVQLQDCIHNTQLRSSCTPQHHSTVLDLQCPRLNLVIGRIWLSMSTSWLPLSSILRTASLLLLSGVHGMTFL